MRKILFVTTVLMVASALAFGQTGTPSTQGGKRSTITGCLTSSKHDTYRLVDQKGVMNMVYSSTVHLDPYVGKFVTLIGNQSATPSRDEGMGKPMPHFVVLEVQPASGTCK